MKEKVHLSSFIQKRHYLLRDVYEFKWKDILEDWQLKAVTLKALTKRE